MPREYSRKELCADILKVFGIAKNHYKYKDIVNAQGLFNHISGKVLQCPLLPSPEINNYIKYQGKKNPYKCPC